MFIFSNLAISLDGKIACADRKHFYLGTPADRRQMQVLRRRTDAVLVGASTLRSFRGPMSIRGSKHQPINAVVSSRLQGISPEWPFFHRKDIKRVLFVSQLVSPRKLEPFLGTCQIIQLRGAQAPAPQVVAALAKLGVKRLLVEGGGGTMWDFVKHKLIDEFHVTLTPWILGGENAPTLVDGLGFRAGGALKLKLVKSKVVGNEIYLTYQRP